MLTRASIRGTRLVALASLLAASALLTPAAPALAHHECTNVPNCVSVSSGTIQLGHSGSASRTLDCPGNAPHFWSWSWDKSSRAVSVWPTATGLGNTDQVYFAVTNWSPHRNTVALYIGCSAAVN